MSEEIRWHLVPDIDLRSLVDHYNPAIAAAASAEAERRRIMSGQPGQKNLDLHDREEDGSD